MREIDFASVEKVIEVDLHKIELYSKLLNDTLEHRSSDLFEIAQAKYGLKSWISELKTDIDGYVSMLEDNLKEVDEMFHNGFNDGGKV